VPQPSRVSKTSLGRIGREEVNSAPKKHPAHACVSLGGACRSAPLRTERDPQAGTHRGSSMMRSGRPSSRNFGELIDERRRNSKSRRRNSLSVGGRRGNSMSCRRNSMSLGGRRGNSMGRRRNSMSVCGRRGYSMSRRGNSMSVGGRPRNSMGIEEIR
jgi:hypothetical protein